MFQIISYLVPLELHPGVVHHRMFWNGGSTACLWKTWNSSKLLREWFHHLLFDREIIGRLHMKVKYLELQSFPMPSNLLESPLITPVWRILWGTAQKMHPASLKSGSKTEVSAGHLSNVSYSCFPCSVCPQRSVPALDTPGILILPSSRSLQGYKHPVLNSNCPW